MYLVKEEVKKIWFYQRTITILSLIISSIFFWSCDTNDDMIISAPNEPIDSTVVVMDTTLVNAPIIQTPSPVIYLADNLDEQDQLGYCIDTRGNGFNEELHAHSCKASGGDVQFYYDDQTLRTLTMELSNEIERKYKTWVILE